jgi:hypothetical protein
MPSTLEGEIREHLTAFLDNQESLDVFKDWLVGATWGIDFSEPQRVVDLVYAIKHEFADHSSGLTDDDELRSALAALAPNGRPGAANCEETRAKTASRSG